MCESFSFSACLPALGFVLFFILVVLKGVRYEDFYLPISSSQSLQAVLKCGLETGLWSQIT